MPRPSNKTKRKKEVLSAYIAAISKNGLAATTLESIAQEANMTRPLVRHHLGNKDAMFDQLVTYVVEQFSTQTNELFNALPDNNRVQPLIDSLFSNSQGTAPELIFVFAELTMRSVNDKVLAPKLAQCIISFEEAIRMGLSDEFPTAPKRTRDAVAHGILAIYFNSISLAPLDMETSHARNTVKLLLQSLEKERQ